MPVAVAASERESLLAGGGGIWGSSVRPFRLGPGRNDFHAVAEPRLEPPPREVVYVAATSSWGRARGVGSSVSITSSNGSAPAPQQGTTIAGATARLARTRPSVGPSAHAQPLTSEKA